MYQTIVLLVFSMGNVGHALLRSSLVGKRKASVLTIFQSSPAWKRLLIPQQQKTLQESE